MECQGFAIGATEAGLLELRYRSIPQPDRWTYVPFSRTETAGDGTLRGFGFGAATWEWDTLTQTHINKLLNFITGDEASGNVYIATAEDRGARAQTFDTFSAIFSRITDGQGKSLIPQTQKPVYSGVTATFTHLVEA